jgi:hypothetical protein
MYERQTFWELPHAPRYSNMATMQSVFEMRKITIGVTIFCTLIHLEGSQVESIEQE